MNVYVPLFFVSGIPALLYQITWERALFTVYGVNIQSVTIIVTIFMLGLGLGSLAGGALAARVRQRPLLAFGCIEATIGIFGAFSLSIFHAVGSLTAGASVAATGALSFALLLVPTFLMGTTLPLLTENLSWLSGNVGASVGTLYSVNALGSGLACLLAAKILVRVLGEHDAVLLAAALNLLVAGAALWLHRRQRPRYLYETTSLSSIKTSRGLRLPMSMAMVLAGAMGFIALAYEIVWYRLYSFTTGGTAPCFAELLGFYLLGLAYGSWKVSESANRELSKDSAAPLRVASMVVILGTAVSFLLGPALAHTATHIPYDITFVFVFASAALLGASFPLLAHAAVEPRVDAGRYVSYLFLSNIIGSAAGSFVCGFYLMDHLDLRTVSLILLSAGVFVAASFSLLAKRATPLFLAGAAVCAIVGAFSKPLYSGIYERLLYKTAYDPAHSRLVSIVENRSGVIAVDDQETVFGGGIYDGRFNIDPLKNELNLIVRAYAAPELRSSASDVLMIGLSSGSWAQVIANAPGVTSLTVVEINPGYLDLIREHPDVVTLLQNPKVHIVIDDGRRWLAAHPTRKFDLIVMNTTYHWRSNASNLLSTEFLQCIREHMNTGGVAFYNTTESARAQITAATVFPYALRMLNFMAVSDAPIAIDKARWRTDLNSWTIDGKSAFDRNDPRAQEQIANWVNSVDDIDGDHSAFENRPHLLARLNGERPITDDNMGTEWGAK